MRHNIAERGLCCSEFTSEVTASPQNVPSVFPKKDVSKLLLLMQRPRQIVLLEKHSSEGVLRHEDAGR